jgi:hypothetical protein
LINFRCADFRCANYVCAVLNCKLHTNNCKLNEDVQMILGAVLNCKLNEDVQMMQPPSPRVIASDSAATSKLYRPGR